MTTRPQPSHGAAGFTLVEILLAVMIAGLAMLTVTGTFVSTLRTHYEIDNLTSSTEAGQRVLALLERDFRGLWHYNVDRNRVLRGRDLNLGGNAADRIDMLTSSDAIGGVLDTGNRLSYPGICEVGYWLKENIEQPGLLELWRREDPLIDDDLLTGGRFQLVTDRIKSFNITYFQTLGYEAEPFEEWDSSREAMLPRRLKIEFTLHRRIGNRNEIVGTEVEDYEKTLKTYVRHIVLDRRYTDIMHAGIAMIPIAPPPPDEAGEGPAGPLGGGGGGPAGGPGGMPGIGDIGTGGDARVDGGRGGRGGRGDQTGPPRGAPPPLDIRDLLNGRGGGAGGLFGGIGGGGGR